jgi:hypothetical protein
VVFVCVLIAASVATAAGPTLNLALKGSVSGKSVSGKVQFGRVLCAPLSGKGLQLIWNGSAKVGGVLKQVSGDMHFTTTGKSAFGPSGATASLVVGGSYSSRLGSTSGTATVAANRKSGTIGVRLAAGSSKVQETGSWTCG